MLVASIGICFLRFISLNKKWFSKISNYPYLSVDDLERLIGSNSVHDLGRKMSVKKTVITSKISVGFHFVSPGKQIPQKKLFSYPERFFEGSK